MVEVIEWQNRSVWIAYDSPLFKLDQLQLKLPDVINAKIQTYEIGFQLNTFFPG